MDLLPPSLPKANITTLLKQAITLVKDQPIEMGQVIKIKVADIKADQTAILKSGDQTLVTSNKTPFTVGQELLVKVSGFKPNGEPELLLITTPKPDTNASKETQKPLETLKQFIQQIPKDTMSKALASVAKSTLIQDQAVQTLINRIEQNHYDTKLPPNGQKIMETLKNNGTFFESKLAKAAVNPKTFNTLILQDNKALLLTLKKIVSERVNQAIKQAIEPSTRDTSSAKQNATSPSTSSITPRAFAPPTADLRTGSNVIVTAKPTAPTGNISQPEGSRPQNIERPAPIPLAPPTKSDTNDGKNRPTRSVEIINIRMAPTVFSGKSNPIWPIPKGTPTLQQGGSIRPSPPTQTFVPQTIRAYQSSLPPTTNMSVTPEELLINDLVAQLDAAVTRIQHHQIQTINQNGMDALIHLLFDLPVKHGEQRNLVEIEIKGDDKKREQAGRQWEVKLRFELDRVGTVTAKIRLQDEHISTAFWVSNPEASTLFEEHLNVLSQRLISLGLEVDQLRCFNQEDPEPSTPPPYPPAKAC